MTTEPGRYESSLNYVIIWLISEKAFVLICWFYFQLEIKICFSYKHHTYNIEQ